MIFGDNWQHVITLEKYFPKKRSKFIPDVLTAKELAHWKIVAQYRDMRISWKC